MQLRIEVDHEVQARLEELLQRKLPEARRRMVDDAMQLTLQSTMDRNPVDTGRSRAAWAAALQQLDGQDFTVSTGEGPSSPTAGRQESGFSRDDTADTTSVAAQNAVPYITYLEYGTSRMAPFAMARGALLQISRRVSQLFRLH